MEFTEKDLDNLSALARISIAPEEKAEMLSSIVAILGYVSEINEISGELAPEKNSVRNVMRDDVVTRNKEVRTAILENAPHTEGDYVKVTQVLK